MATQNSDNNILFGTTATGNAAAGDVGEFISSQIVFGSPVSISNSTLTNLTSISLTAGDWDVWANVYFTPAASTVPSNFAGGISTTSAIFPDVSLQFSLNKTTSTGVGQAFCAPNQRINISSTTTVYIVIQSVFTTSTMTACGGIYARRRR